MLSQFLQVVYQLSYTCDKMTIEYETEDSLKRQWEENENWWIKWKTKAEIGANNNLVTLYLETQENDRKV